MEQPGDPGGLIPARTLLGLPFPHRIKQLHKNKEGSLLSC